MNFEEMLRIPPKFGLYDPAYEHESCGIGFVANIAGKKSHQIVSDAISVLNNLRHRGACGCEVNTGDGAGILIQTPHSFLKGVCKKKKIRLPEAGGYGTGIVFLSPNTRFRKATQRALEEIVAACGQKVLGWRQIPVNNSSLGKSALVSEPVMSQIFIGRSAKLKDEAAFERKLYVIRKRAENAIRFGGKFADRGGESFYIASLSYKTVVYKGMLMSEQLSDYFPDLSSPEMESALGLVHARFSTNTFPSWERAHPYRTLCHNGEINTLRGNINWMHARQMMFESDLFGDDLKKILPVICPDGSDSAMFDNALEFLTLAGRDLSHVMMMMIPEPWERHESMSREKRAFYEYHASLQEPWDGPASMAFTDGVKIGAVLDRNGLRPSRYYVTKDGRVVLASEVGVLEIPPTEVIQKGRLQPGRMLLIDTEAKEIIDDGALKQRIATAEPYARWLKENLVTLEELPEPPEVPLPDHDTILKRQQAFGYTFEELRMIMTPMARDGVEAVGSMGNDAPLAVLSNRPHLLFNYFKQLFAQVTNPAIDCIREELITSAETTIGPEGDLLHPRPESCRQIKLKSPILTNTEMYKLKHLNWPGFRSKTLPILFNPLEGGRGLEAAMTGLFAEADKAIEDGINILFLSDRGIGPDKAAIPSLLAVSGLHHHLIRNGTRTRTGLVIETGEPREVHHFSLLIGYGAGAINPYLAFETLEDMIRQGLVSGITHEQAVANFIKAVVKGVVKVMSKMGISTIQSYRGAQIFEAVGLNRDLIDRYFSWTASRIGGIGLAELAREAAIRHDKAYPKYGGGGSTLDAGGFYQWRQDGEYHMFNPATVHKLQMACRTGSYPLFKEFSSLLREREENLCTLRGLLDFKTNGGSTGSPPVPIDEVESVEEICRRFKTGAMSFGSISQEAHETLAIAMNRIGGKSNTGEGGEDPVRFTPDPNGDLRSSAIKQVASGRFGVTSEYLASARELQIKVAQGAKPGEGGQLPGSKVYPWIARVRFSTPGVGLISPPPHHDIYSIEDLAQLIHDLKNSNPEARVSVKLVSEVGVGTIAAGVAKAKADVVLISGDSGGTGASPQTSIKYAGLPWELGLAETHQTLVLNDLRSRIVVETDGQLKTGRDVVIAALLGAEEFGFSTAPLIALGCIYMRVCHLNTCPVGVATQDPELRKKFTGDPQHVVNFMRFIAQEVRELMAELGFRKFNDMVGRVDRLKTVKVVKHWKARGLDISPLLAKPPVGEEIGRFCNISQDHGLDASLDRLLLLKLCEPAIKFGEKVRADLPIKNTHRVVGTLVGHAITKRYGSAGLPEGTIRLKFTGSAGQSFGAFLPKGVHFTLEGDANDYIGKGLSGGTIVVAPPAGSPFVPEENIIVGNVAFYGATAGEAFIRGMAGERFCVRNSGVSAVVESVGDHGCEYMTGGRVVVLGPVGRNFGAGMSGGIAYVLDEQGTFAGFCNQNMVALEEPDGDDLEEVRKLVIKHAEATRSQRAWNILSSWKQISKKFVKVFPKDYKRMLETLKSVTQRGLTGDEAVMAAFWENTKDKARVSGN